MSANRSIERMKESIKIHGYLREDQLRQLINIIDRPQVKLYAYLLGYTGRRASELLQLRARDVHIDDNSCEWTIIKKRKTEANPTGRIKAELTFIDEAEPIIGQTILNYAEKNKIKYEQYIFESTKNPDKPLTNKWGWKWITYYADKLNALLEEPIKIKQHTLRHTFGIMLAKRGVPPIIIKELMQHEDIRVTQIYLDIAMVDIKQVLKTHNFNCKLQIT